MNKEVIDSLHTLLHCSLKDTEYKTQKEQFKIVYDYITDLQQENKQLKSILTELEEWLKEQGNNGIDEWGNHYTVCLYKLNELKEKYK